MRTEKGCKGGLLPSCYFQAILLYSGLKPPGTVIDPDTFNSALKDKGTQMSAAVKSAQPGVPITPAEVAQQKVSTI